MCPGFPRPFGLLTRKGTDQFQLGAVPKDEGAVIKCAFQTFRIYYQNTHTFPFRLNEGCSADYVGFHYSTLRSVASITAFWK
jgi:hypothetical protein